MGLDGGCTAQDLPEADDLILAARLRVVERLVGGAQQLRPGGSVVRVRRDSGAQPEREACLAEAVAELATEPVGRLEGSIRVGAGEHDHELVAAEPGRLAPSGQVRRSTSPTSRNSASPNS